MQKKSLKSCLIFQQEQWEPHGPPRKTLHSPSLPKIIQSYPLIDFEQKDQVRPRSVVLRSILIRWRFSRKRLPTPTDWCILRVLPIPTALQWIP